MKTQYRFSAIVKLTRSFDGAPHLLIGKGVISNLSARLSVGLLMTWSWLAAAHGGVAVRIGQNFTGSTDSKTFFTDPSGAVGGNYFVEFNIDTFAAYSLADGSAVATLSGPDFWSQAGVTSPTSWGNARVAFDPTAQRWFAAQAVGDTSAQLVMAVSATADPNGAWNGFLVPGGVGVSNQAYFVNLGLDAQGVYVSGVYGDGGPSPLGCTLVSFPKSDLLLNPPVITNRTYFGLLNAATYGYNIKPAICIDGSAGGDVLATAGRGMPGDNNSALFAFSVQNAAGPGPARLSSVRTASVATYAAPPNALQPDGSSNLDTFNAAFQANVYRVGGVLFSTDAIQVGEHAAIRWYRVSSTNYALLESGTISDPSLDLYYPSIAANTNGTVVIACNGSGTNTFVSCFAAVGGTVRGNTTFGKLLLLNSGAASYQNLDGSGYNNWGRFGTTCVDPIDPNAFWTINTCAAGPTTWATQITQLLTSPSPSLSITSTGGNLLLSWPVTDVSFQLESAPSLQAGSSWSSVSQSPLTNGTTVSVLISLTNSSSFFRLVQ